MIPPDHLPAIIIEDLGTPFVSFICPPCSGHGRVEESRTEHINGNYVTSTKFVACAHCFGFGRLPLPSWYRDQDKAP